MPRINKSGSHIVNTPKGCTWYLVENYWEKGKYVLGIDEFIPVCKLQPLSIEFSNGLKHNFYIEGNVLAKDKQQVKDRIYTKVLRLFSGNGGKWENVLLNLLEMD